MIKSVNYCCSRMMPTQQSDSMTNVEGAKSAANAMMALGVENVPQAVSGPGCGGSQKSLSSVSNCSKVLGARRHSRGDCQFRVQVEIMKCTVGVEEEVGWITSRC